MTQFVRRNKEIVEFVTLVIIFISLACVAKADTTNFEPYSNQFHKVYSLKSPQGKRMSIKTDSAIKNVSAKLAKLGVKSKNQKCSTNTVSLDNVEVELELTGLIDKLKTQAKPRFLTDSQKAILAKVPGCDSHSTELSVIAGLIKGYDLVKVSYL